jgi:hypothetical protein
MSPTCVMLASLLAITAGYLVSRYNLSRYKITPLVIIVLLLLIVGFLALDLYVLALASIVALVLYDWMYEE